MQSGNDGAAFPEPIDVADLGPLLALNNAHAQELSLLDENRFRHLVGTAFLARRIGAADALLLAFDQTADYDSPNFLWFRDRHPKFVYVDRIVVDHAARGRGLARLLYESLFAEAKAAGHDVIGCEVNSVPPNPGSDAFHAALGFEQIGEGRIGGGEKRVCYLLKSLR